MISQEQQSEEVRVALGIRHLFENLAGHVALHFQLSEKELISVIRF